MILRFNLPKEIENIVTKSGEEIYYAVPFDVDENGSWKKDAYFVVTVKHLWIIEDGECKESVAISDITRAHAETQVNCGCLCVEQDGVIKKITNSKNFKKLKKTL